MGLKAASGDTGLFPVGVPIGDERLGLELSGRADQGWVE